MTPIIVEPGTGPPPVPGPGSQEGWVLDGLDLNVAPIVVAQATNFVTNPSFEAGVDAGGNPTFAAGFAAWGWTNSGLLAMQRGGGVNRRRSGNYGLYTYNETAGGDKYAVFQVPAGPVLDAIKGKTVTLTGWVYKQSGWSVGAGGSDRTLLLGDSAGFSEVSGMTAAPADVFTRFTLTRTVSSTATFLDCRVYNGGIGVVYWDEIMLVEGATSPAYFAGDTPGYKWAGNAHSSISIPTPQIVLEAVNYPPAGKRFDRVLGADSDGSRLVRPPRYDDATLELRLRVAPQATKDGALAHLGALTAKLQEAELLAADTGRGMALVWTPADSALSRTLYVKGGEVSSRPIAVQGDDAGWMVRSPVVEVTLTCDPFMYGAEVTGTAVTASTPLVEVTVPSVAGDVAAEGRLIVTDAASQPRKYVAWGLEQRAQAGRDLTLTVADLTVTGFAGASVAGNGAYSGTNVLSATLTTSPVAVCGTGNQPHVGVYRVMGRVYTTLATRFRLAWKFGDAPFTRMPYASSPAASAWVEVDLGLVTIPRAVLGAQRFQAQIEAYSTITGDTFAVDYLALLPAGEGAGKALVTTTFETATTFSARDEFDQTAGALTGKTAPAGGVWAGAGDADDFTMETASKTAVRSALFDADSYTGRYAVSGAAALAAQVVQVDLTYSEGTTALLMGVLARYTDTNNWLMATYSPDLFAAGSDVSVRKRVAGTVTTLATVAVPHSGGSFVSLRLTVDAGGRWSVWLWPTGASPVAVANGQDSVLATGGTLASGKPGFYDAYTDPTAIDRAYDNFLAFPPTADAAVSSGQSLEVRHNDTIREDPTGTYWGRPQTYRGSRFYLPAAGDDALTSRVAVMARRNNIEETAEANVTDSTTVQVAHVPRWLVAPRA